MGRLGYEKNEDNFGRKLAMDSGERRKSSNSIEKNFHQLFSPGDPHIVKNHVWNEWKSKNPDDAHLHTHTDEVLRPEVPSKKIRR